MIYQYPEEFIVPVAYVQDLKDKTLYRCQESESLHADKLVISDKELNGNEIFLKNMDMYEIFKNKEINFLNMDKEILQEHMINEEIVEEGTDDENIKNILSDIDEDYANNETLDIKV